MRKNKTIPNEKKIKWNWEKKIVTNTGQITKIEEKIIK